MENKPNNATDERRTIAGLLKRSNKIAFFGGAGVSTESGVKDYRSEDGLYNTVKEYGVSPETILSHTFFMRHTETFYDFYRKYFLEETPKPNKAHAALARLEQMGKITGVVTQNIDGLHQAAGSRRVFELHGTIAEYFCMGCGSDFSINDVRELLASVTVPRCPKCGGLIKPRVTRYEENLDGAVIEGAIDAIEAADLLIIGGTSLAVWPAASFVNYFRGNDVILINREPTAYDRNATVVSRGRIGEVLSGALEIMETL